MRATSHLPSALLAAVLGVCGTASAAPIVEYTFAGNSAAATTLDPNLTASPFVDGDGTLDFSATGNPAPSVFKSYTDLPNGSFNSTAYFGFSVTPVLGYELDLTSLVFDAQRNQVTGQNASNAHVTIEARSSTDNFVTSTTLGSFLLTENSGNFVANLTQNLAMQDQTQTVGFRLYVRDAGRADTTLGFRLDNVELNGTVAAVLISEVPEPTSAILFATGAAAPVVWRNRRRQRRQDQVALVK